MPLIVGVPLVVVLGAVLLLAFLAWYYVMVRPWLEEAGNIALIGRYIQRAGDALERGVEAVWRRFVAEPAKALAGYLTGVAAVLVELPEQVVELAATVKQALHYLRHEAIPRMIEAAVAPLERGIDALDRLVDRTRAEAATLARGIDARIDRLTDVVIPDLRADVRGWVADLERWGRGIEGRLEALSGRLVDQAIRPLEQLRDVVIPRLTGRVKGVEDELEAVAPYVLGLAGAVTLAQAIEGIRAASRAKPKLDRMCVLDLDEMDDLIGLAFVGLSMAALVQLVREGQGLAELHSRLVEELISE